MVTPRKTTARAPKKPEALYEVDLLTRVKNDLESAKMLGSAAGDLALTLAEIVANTMFAEGPRVSAAKTLADMLKDIHAGPTQEDEIDRIKIRAVK